MPELVEYHGVPVLVCDASGDTIADVQDALDHLIGAAFTSAEVVAVPSARLDDRFFDLSTGLAGAILQTCANYRLRLVVLGDIGHHLSAGSALSDLVSEANRGRDIWFLSDLDALADRMAPNGDRRPSGRVDRPRDGAHRPG
ncbi:MULTISPECIES: DUF4180 domain-containing protein [Streptomyces]|uniref:DUF4180 domain-containing protein n=1 Tax=Streptomyces griseus subsp. griseus (strain JCM 4626 / CBS 651.72 / NBRC 13350 / KCC S-0626 / ISP 5235) TaxID=455632 RepID=B1VNV4_STRGG|nr:DUF4180 domain-containing protein [Streptomyces griseus]MYR14086.1 DUF4180 domain-containing protein [Streptomyces sp. SID724]MBW3702753.1 DUF4180 domain-containing protein [Streptomyces griseus]NEB51571.1 DUF4180 domain-containing protein [Streptomyces griseus]SED80446.1 protein of unknown function [Streptomyces griseus]SQA26864.1 Alpha/beta hydrolase [Streptomyces griseus]